VSAFPAGSSHAGGRLTWLGHSTVVIELDGVRLVTDPLLRRRVAHLVRDTEPPAVQSVDAVLLSHLHFDHLDLPSLEALGRSTPIVAPRGSRRLLRRFADVTEIAVGETIGIGGVGITATPAAHDGRRWPIGRPLDALGYVIEGSSRVYFAGDTDLFPGMAELAPVDVALLPVWGWGRTVGHGHLDPPRASAAVGLLRPRVVVPIHWGTYRIAGARRPDRSPPERFRGLALDAEVRILAPGESLALPVS
jgi:L-ascorbate metabolism protein UlaG (beta-lactamase superfamily)